MNQLTKELMCIAMRNSVHIWLERDRMEAVYQVLEKSRESRFVSFDGIVINTADIVGIFTSQQMDDIEKRKCGLWSCKFGEWHSKAEHSCECWKLNHMRQKTSWQKVQPWNPLSPSHAAARTGAPPPTRSPPS